MSIGKVYNLPKIDCTAIAERFFHSTGKILTNVYCIINILQKYYYSILLKINSLGLCFVCTYILNVP